MANKSDERMTSLQDCCDFLRQSDFFRNSEGRTSPTAPYDQIIELMRKIDLHDDGIMMNNKIKDIESFFCNVITDENMLRESMEYINNKALEDHDTSMKFAIVFASRKFDSLAMNETKIRHVMVSILERNFVNSSLFREVDKNRLYNYITLLGEYYHRIRICNNKPVKILGKSLLNLLISELESVECINVRLAKLILSQITLNGDEMRTEHKQDLTTLLFHLRRIIIERPLLKARVKALLMMTLDLFYSNFTNLGKELEEMYTKYLVDGVDEENDIHNNNNNANSSDHTDLQNEVCNEYTGCQKPFHVSEDEDIQRSEHELCTNVNPSFDDFNNDSIESDVSKKKWSEQLMEDLLYEDEFANCSISSYPINENEATKNFQIEKPSFEQNDRNTKRSYHPHLSPRPLKQMTNNSESSRNNSRCSSYQLDSNAVDDRNETKPLPRWRTTRFNNRNFKEKANNERLNQNMFGESLEDERSCKKSENGTIRLYSVNDRLKYVQDKYDRKPSSHNIVISNWDRQSQRDDRSERSYLSNYERGYHKKNNRQYNNRQMYDKPPRFQKKSLERSHSPDSNNSSYIQSESWRRGQLGSDQDIKNNFSKTLPRGYKNKFDNENQDKYRSYYKRNENGRDDYSLQHSKTKPFGSQNSIISDPSNNFEINRNKQRIRGYKNRPNNWNSGNNNDTMKKEESHEKELVLNAQHTTKYMKFLSSKK